MKILKLKIDVTKIDKTRLFQGQKGTYLDATLFLEDEPDQYGNHGMITQDVSKEEREAGQKGPILGNGKIAWEGESRRTNDPEIRYTSQQDKQPMTASTADLGDGDDIPF